MKNITPELVLAVNHRIAQQLAETGKASRASVCDALGIKDHNTVSRMFKNGELPDYKLLRKVGIVPTDYQTKAVTKNTDAPAASNSDEPEPLTDVTGCDV